MPRPYSYTEVKRLHYTSSVDTWAVGCLAFELVGQIWVSLHSTCICCTRFAGMWCTRELAWHISAVQRKYTLAHVCRMCAGVHVHTLIMHLLCNSEHQHTAQHTTHCTQTVGFPPFIAEKTADITDRINKGQVRVVLDK